MPVGEGDDEGYVGVGYGQDVRGVYNISATAQALKSDGTQYPPTTHSIFVHPDFHPHPLIITTPSLNPSPVHAPQPS